MTAIVPVLLAGGSGTRLWPLSREQYPKQFLRLRGEHSLLQDTALRAQALEQMLPALVLCGEAHRFIVAEQLLEAGIGEATIILEPEARNTAPAAAVAALQVVSQSGTDAVILMMPADQVMANQVRFAHAVQIAVTAASDGRIVTFGIPPTRPETGYGYIRTGSELEPGLWSVDAFVEKPDERAARAFIAAGGHYWNGGMLVFRAGTLIDELQQFEPQTLQAAAESLRIGRRDPDFVRLDAAAFRQTRATSIDYAVMERTRRAALVRLDAGWDDVGSWRVLEALPTDTAGNGTRGDVLLEAAANNLVHAQSRLVVVAGVDDLIVVETADAVLVTQRDRATAIKAVVARLSADHRREVVEHRQVYRPWGSYESIGDGSRFQVKRIIVKPRGKLSLQQHYHRAEHWVVVRGTARVTCGERVFLLHEDQSTYIPLGEKHRLENPGVIALELIEVQSGPYLGEDDIVRFDDAYGRVAT
ncbi:mannose-1-phosphate guanylyltransferase/mannose-6-phosphate isomerase [Sinimarinibacterium flocculans]|uniref:mannose-1-phosphate guanylyltransferase/mannose-6-phosphate isomerase n=1 Tax=Sinimarinibacterium flocculans TaxID=985250 RepID=UPI00248F4D12|nr:mannose-1-phosphate guanylyltransferase/mannose-6-phosphate isomerase [Sinimarinibacterium flocculans]